MAKINTGSCPRCNGAVLDYQIEEDSPMCVMCGWRDQPIGVDAAIEIATALGRPTLGITNRKAPIGTGKVRSKRRKKKAP